MSKLASTLKPPPKYKAILNDQVKDFTCIRIIDGKFKNVEYHYDVITMGEDDGSDSVPLTFTYQLVSGNISEAQTPKFYDTIASILFAVIVKIKDHDEKVKDV